jgi:hypothetical protein
MIFPSILPTCAIHTPLRLLGNEFPTVPAPNLLFYNVIVCKVSISLANDEQRKSNQDEAHQLVNEGPVHPNDGSIVNGLLRCVVDLMNGVRSTLEKQEFLFYVPTNKGEARDDGEDNVRDERGCNGSKGCSKTVLISKSQRVKQCKSNANAMQMFGEGRGPVHQTKSNFQHIVPKCEFPEAVPRHFGGVGDIIKVEIAIAINVEVIYEGGHIGPEETRMRQSVRTVFNRE